MADVTSAFIQGHQAGQAEIDHQQQLQENKLRLAVLKHTMDGLKIEDQLRAGNVARQRFEALTGQPAADLPTDAVTTQQPDLPARSLAGVVTGLVQDRLGGGGMSTTGTPTPALDATTPDPTTIPAPAAQAPAGEHPLVTMVRRMVQVPGIDAMNGAPAVPGYALRPQSAEEMTARAIATKRAEEPAHVVGPEEVLAGPDASGNIVPQYTNTNPKPSNTEIGQYQQIYAETAGGAGTKFKDLTIAQKNAFIPFFTKAKEDPVVQARLQQGADANVAFKDFLVQQGKTNTADREQARLEAKDRAAHASDVSNGWKTYAAKVAQYKEQYPGGELTPGAPPPPEIYTPPSFEEWQGAHPQKGSAAPAGKTPVEGAKGTIKGKPVVWQTVNGKAGWYASGQ